MARFYGTVQGGRGVASRLGHQHITTVAASWRGAVQVTLTEDENGVTRARIETVRWQGAGASKLLFDGELSSLNEGPGDAGCVRGALGVAS